MESRVVALEVRNLSKHFGGVKAIDQINMKVYENEIVAIVGDNGAGKSTLIKSITGFYRIDSGEIFINGKKVDIYSPSDARKYGIETVYQSEGFISIFDAAGNLFLGRLKAQNNLLGKLFKFTDDRYMREETDTLLNKIGIKLKDNRSKLSDLSGGERQSVLVGRAVYWGGRILIFDEPTNNLSVMQQKKVIEIIKNIKCQYQNVSIIIISHNINHVFELADRVIVLRNGIIVAEKLKEETNPEEIVAIITGAVKINNSTFAVQ